MASQDKKPFNPDEYLKAKTQSSGNFDPDAYLAAKSGPEKMGMGEAIGRKFTKGFTFGLDPVISGAAEGIAQGAGALSGGADFSDALAEAKKGFVEGRQYKIEKNKEASDVAGAYGTAAEIGGGAVPMLAAGGAGLLSVPTSIAQAFRQGAAMGAAEAAGYAESPLEAAGQIGGGAVVGGGLYGLGKGLMKVGGMAKDALSRKSSNFSDVIKSGQELGVKVTPGTLSPQDSTIRGLESSIEQSPSIGGALFRREVRPGRETVSDVFEKVGRLGEGVEAYDTGRKIKGDLVTEFAERLAPVKKSFQNIRESTGFIDVSPKTLNAVSNNIRNIPEVRIGQGQGYANKAIQFAENLKNVQNADELKMLRTSIGKEIELASRQGDFNSASVLGDVLDRVSRLETNSIKRAAISQARKGAEGREIAKGLLSDLKSTRKDYSTLMKDAQKFADNAGLGKVKTPEAFLRALDETPNESIAKKLFDSNDFDSIKYLKEHKPNIWNDVKALKMQQIVDASMTQNREQVSPLKMIRNLDKYGDNVLKELLGDEKMFKSYQSARRLALADPGKYATGKSLTPEALDLMKILNPFFQLTELGRYGAYKALPRAGGVLTKTGSGITRAVPLASKTTAGLLGDE